MRIVTLLVALLPFSALAGGKCDPSLLPMTIQGQATVIDGDTLRIDGYHIRLDGIDAPEIDEVVFDESDKLIRIGQQAKKTLEELIGGQDVTCQLTRCGYYKRWVGSCMEFNMPTIPFD